MLRNHNLRIKRQQQNTSISALPPLHRSNSVCHTASAALCFWYEAQNTWIAADIFLHMWCGLLIWLLGGTSLTWEKERTELGPGAARAHTAQVGAVSLNAAIHFLLCRRVQLQDVLSTSHVCHQPWTSSSTGPHLNNWIEFLPHNEVSGLMTVL